MNKNFAINLKIIITLFLGIILMFVLANVIAQNKLADLSLETRLLISKQENLLTTIAQTTARNGADSITKEIIRDCSATERAAFDSLLDSLDDGLSKSQLVELERLFGRCGGFFSERKSIMVARLSREIEVYQTYVEQLALIDGEDVRTEFKISQWQKLAEHERKQSQLFSQLVRQQDQIINILLAGKSAQSAEIKEILREVEEVKGTLEVVSQQTSSLRDDLISF